MSKDKQDKKILDSDADGLLDYEEKALGTDPYSVDTDKDGLGDYQEVKVYKTDPLKSDTDCDGMEDGNEVKSGSNPRGNGSLRNLFIPTQCNNFKPGVLHPKRIAFYAASAVVMKVIIVLFALSFPAHAWLSSDILAEQSKKIIALTNNIRKELNISPLQENQVLNQAALNKAQDMLVDQYFAHVSPDDRALRHWLYDLKYNFKFAGENLAIGFSDANNVVAAWKESPTHYSNIIDPDFTEIGVGVVSGDYNGYETTLIAQYFGNPYSQVTPVVIKEAEEVIAKNQDYNTKVEQAIIKSEPEAEEIVAIENKPEEIVEEPPVPEVPNDVILPEQEEIILQTPVLINPENNYISKENINTFTFLAKGAQRVAAYVDGELAASKVIDNEKFDVAIKLEEGQHSLQLIAYQGDKSLNSSYYTVIVDKTAPILDQKETNILVNQATVNKDLVLKATAYLSDDTVDAFVNFADNKIVLTKDYSQAGRWTGHQIISGVEYDTLFNPVVLATLTARDKAENVLVQDISWQDIKPVAGSTVSQYSFLKQSNSELITPLFKIGNIYYQIMLIIAFIALLLNIFIQIKRQHLSTIASTLGLIALLSFLTIF